MARAGVPLVPGYHGDNNDPAFLQAQADAMGYPVLIKASAGGGGKGMRRVERPEDFTAALAACQREARASFGNDHVLIERYVTRPRHIEIQVFADQHGQCVHLFERDCSVQRRHQKVLEESPAPGLSDERRAEMGAAAVAAAQAVGYVGAGTVEFIAEPTPDGDLRFYFMEMNTRLQVEHPVTEAITGLDLVDWQLQVAAGRPLPLRQHEMARRGHAIEARLCAENPDAQFLPAAGRLGVARWPEHVRFAPVDHLPRLDTGFGEGDEVSAHYDSMIAKLIVWGEDRAQALARLSQALGQTQVLGLHTNVPFLRRLVQTQAFASADLDTALIEREHAALFNVPALERPWALAAVAAQELLTLQDRAQHPGADVWQRLGPWRLHGPARLLRRWEVDGQTSDVVVEHESVAEGDVRFTLHGNELGQTWHACSGASAEQVVLWRDGHRQTLRVIATPSGTTVTLGLRQAQVLTRDPLLSAAAQADHGGGVTAPMPGKVLSLLVPEGASVQRGQALAIMEAMKMEHTLSAPGDGVVQAWLYQPGDQVAEGAALLQWQAPSAAPASDSPSTVL